MGKKARKITEMKRGTDVGARKQQKIDTKKKRKRKGAASLRKRKMTVKIMNVISGRHPFTYEITNKGKY